MATDNTCFIPLTNWVDPPVTDPVDRVLAWPLDDLCCPDLPPLETRTPEQVAIWNRSKAAAIDLMYTQTCSVYNICNYCFRPCLPHTCCGGNDLLGVNFCSDECSRVSLNIHDYVNPFYDVVSITTYDGTGGEVVLVRGTDYEIDGNFLIPYMSGGLWPWPRQSRQYPLNYASPDPDVLIQTWSVCVRTGEMPPQSVLNAAGALACNIYNTCTGRPCDIPTNATSVSKEGVTVNLEMSILKGIPLVAAAISTYGNCEKARISRLIDPSVWVG